MSLLTKTNPNIKPGIYNGILDRFFRDNFNDLWNTNIMETLPLVNIKENKDSFNIEMAAPGLKKEDFKIDVEGNLLTISSEKETEKKEEDKSYSKREYNYSSFSRSFTLPETANAEKINAKYVDGVLHLFVPKKEEAVKAKSKKIAVA